MTIGKSIKSPNMDKGIRSDNTAGQWYAANALRTDKPDVPCFRCGARDWCDHRKQSV